MGKRIFARDREAQSRTLDPCVRCAPALIERFEDARPVRQIDPGALIDDIDDRVAVLDRQVDRHQTRPRRILDRIREQVVDDRADLIGVPDNDGRPRLHVERNHACERRELVLPDHASHHVGEGQGAERLRLDGARLMVVEQVFDQLLEVQCVLAHDADDFLLLRRKLATDAIAQQLRAFAHRSERRLELVGNVAEKLRLLCLELLQTRAQPFQALADVAQVLWSVHFDGMREVRGPHATDRQIELTNGPGDQDGEQNRQRERDRCSGERQVDPGPASFRRGLLQALDLALGERAACSKHCLRTFGKCGVTLRERCSRARGALRRLQLRIQSALAIGEFLELRELRAIERQLLQLLSRLTKVLPQPRVILHELRIIEDQVLAYNALQGRRLFVELATRSTRLRCLHDGLLALRAEAIEAHDQLDQRIQQRQADEKKT